MGGMLCGMGLFGEPARYSADYQLINIEASHEAWHMVMVS